MNNINIIIMSTEKEEIAKLSKPHEKLPLTKELDQRGIRNETSLKKNIKPTNLYHPHP
jgi:hypothetical protein